jgi:hypothetical protein
MNELILTSPVAFLDALDEEGLPIDVCNFNTLNSNFSLRDIVVHARNSASHSETLFGDLVSNIDPNTVDPVSAQSIGRNHYIPVVLKLFPDYSNPNSDPLNRNSYPTTEEDMDLVGLDTGRINNLIGLNYEIEVYEFISRMILPGISPNFISFINAGVCSYNQIRTYGINRSIRTAAAHSMPRNSIGSIDDVNPHLGNYIFLITERAGNGARFGVGMSRDVRTLTQFAVDWRYTLTRREITPEMFNLVWEHIYFQLIWAVASLAHFGINHNDLHSGNVIVVLYERTIPLEFRFTHNGVTKIFKILTRCIPYIFDFDFAQTRTQIGINRKLMNHPELDLFNFSETRDLYTLFCTTGWTGRIGRTYRNDATKMAEENETNRISISQNQFGSIQLDFEELHGIRNLYRVHRSDLERIIGASIEFLPDLPYLTIQLHDHFFETGEYYLTLAHTHRCRTLQDDIELPLPKDFFIGDYFDNHTDQADRIEVPQNNRFVLNLDGPN